jgi:hypothetical protein
VSSYTLVANHVPINARIIGTHEHESHFVFDLLHNNTTDVRPERHSTDTHGTNQVNFWILNVFDYLFAPRYRNLRKKAESLVGFRHPKHYADSLIKPSRKVPEPLICSEWPNIQRIMASLAQKDVTQATVVRKLSAYARQNRTKKALADQAATCTGSMSARSAIPASISAQPRKFRTARRYASRVLRFLICAAKNSRKRFSAPARTIRDGIADLSSTVSRSPDFASTSSPVMVPSLPSLIVHNLLYVLQA